jgi:hypothetical protein
MELNFWINKNTGPEPHIESSDDNDVEDENYRISPRVTHLHDGCKEDVWMKWAHHVTSGEGGAH